MADLGSSDVQLSSFAILVLEQFLSMNSETRSINAFQ
jgi:hypothetical protein